MTTIFLSSRYSRRDEMREWRTKLQELGFEVNCRWLDTEWEETQRVTSAAPPEYREEFAHKDAEDVANCDCLIAFTEAPDSGGNNRGGRHVEYGMALALGKVVVVIGYRENIFHHAKGVIFFNTTSSVVDVAAEIVSATRS